MTGEALKKGRVECKLTQAEAARGLGLSQPYLSQLERGRRPVTRAVAAAATRLYQLPPTAMPLPEKAGDRVSRGELPRLLAALSYPPYAHVRKRGAENPAFVVYEAVTSQELDGRAAEALPWVLHRYSDLDWTWLTAKTKLRDAQNRLGFLVSLAREVAEQGADAPAAERLSLVERSLEPSRLAAETTLGRESMPEAEREWLRRHRSDAARHWNVLSGLKVQDLPYAR